MRAIRTRKDLARFLSPWRFFAVLGGTLVLIFLVAFAGKAFQNYRIHQEAEALRLEVEELKREKAKLDETRAYVQTDDYVEKAAREELHWSKPGEIYLVIVPESEDQPLKPESAEQVEATETTPVTEEDTSHTEALWQSWWVLFFDSPPGE
jgi:cell division protein FtsB